MTYTLLISHHGNQRKSLIKIIFTNSSFSIGAFLVKRYSVFSSKMPQKSIEESEVKMIQEAKPVKEPKEEISTNGLYRYIDDSAELEITIYNDRWSGKTVMISGFGAEYDQQNAIQDNGVVNGNDLFDSSGMVKIGNVVNNQIYTSVGRHHVTLKKEI